MCRSRDSGTSGCINNQHRSPALEIFLCLTIVTNSLQWDSTANLRRCPVIDLKEIFVPLSHCFRMLDIWIYLHGFQRRGFLDHDHYDPLHAQTIQSTDMCGCKRSFGSFAAPLSPFQAAFPNAESTAQGREIQPQEKDFRDRPIGEHIAAGRDLSGQVFGLTNKIHPIFRSENICVCKYTEPLHCCAPYFAANPDQLPDKKAPAIASPYPAENPIVRTILQLATKFLPHDDTLPFWAGILDCARGPRQEVARFHVTRKRLSEARKADTLEQINRFADELRFHFREFGEEDGVDELCNGYACTVVVEEQHPDFDAATNSHSRCDRQGFSTCDCPPGPAYAFRNGKPVVENSRFQHIFINIKSFTAYDVKSARWRDGSIWDLQGEISRKASVICHEFSHAFMEFHVGRDACMNDESLLETGFSWESFAFGGTINEIDGSPSICLTPWPNLEVFERYVKVSAAIDIRHFGKLDYPRIFRVEPSQFTEFLHHEFWEEERPGGRQMWLRPYHEAPVDEEEYTRFSSGHQAPIEVSAKKQRLSDAAMDRQRRYASNIRRGECMARADRWYRCKEKSLERKEDFHEGARGRLDAL